jgi:hypothetical protein
MSHDKTKAAIRERMARTGEPYTVARRAIAAGDGERPRWFAISYRNQGIDRITAALDGLLGAGPGRAGVEIGDDELRLTMGRWRQRIPRAGIRSAGRSQRPTHGTTGVHVSRGRLLVNGGPDGLVELALDPPCRTDRTMSSGFQRARVDTLVMSLVDPDGFLVALSAGWRDESGVRHT